ncbi:hypothetical protein MGN70_011304 [Eutypa lata]|nr:hypothetical protein MGN70_011304 [Eutypa lata]
MLTQLKPDTSTVYWAASLVVAGLGSGMAMQLPYTAVAVVLDDEDIAIGNAIAVLFYQLGGAVAISLGQTITISTILNLVSQRLPEIPGQLIITMGAARLTVVGASIPFTLGMEWLNSIRASEERKKASESQQQEKVKEERDMTFEESQA